MQSLVLGTPYQHVNNGLIFTLTPLWKFQHQGTWDSSQCGVNHACLPMPCRYTVGVLLAQNVLNWLSMRFLHIIFSYTSDKMGQEYLSLFFEVQMTIIHTYQSLMGPFTQIFSFHLANYHKHRLIHKVTYKIFALVWSAL